MEPLPETRDAIEQLAPYFENDILEDLMSAAEQVSEIVPDCVGFSVAAFSDEVTFTVVASGEEVALLDAVQYLAGGPCIAGARLESAVLFHPDDPLDEQTWQDFARATAQRAICSTLTLPIREGGQVVGSVNLYAAAAQAFAGHEEALAEIFGAWAPGAVSNADLAFRTRHEATISPQRLRERTELDRAAGVLASGRNLDVEEAERLIDDAARRAGVSPRRVAGIVTDLFQTPC